jgi:tRNA G18 (ribose-2'-O)-methylase SpoU
MLRERQYRLFTLEPTGGAPLDDFELPQNSAFIFGHEEVGLSFERSDFPDIERLTIPHSGVVQSLNVSVAASIVMYEYVRHRRLKEGPSACPGISSPMDLSV